VSDNAATLLAGAVLAAAFVLGLGPVPEIGFVLQMFGLGGALGLAAAYRARRRGITTDPWLITTRWSLSIGVGASLFALLIAVL
jgi:hypothetical protein